MLLSLIFISSSFAFCPSDMRGLPFNEDQDLSNIIFIAEKCQSEARTGASDLCDCMKKDSISKPKPDAFKRHQVKTVMKKFETVLLSIASDMQHLQARSMQFINSDPSLKNLPSNIALDQFTSNSSYQAKSCNMAELENRLRACSNGKETYFNLIKDSDPLSVRSLKERHKEEQKQRNGKFRILGKSNCGQGKYSEKKALVDRDSCIFHEGNKCSYPDAIFERLGYEKANESFKILTEISKAVGVTELKDGKNLYRQLKKKVEAYSEQGGRYSKKQLRELYNKIKADPLLGDFVNGKDSEKLNQLNLALKSQAINNIDQLINNNLADSFSKTSEKCLKSYSALENFLCRNVDEEVNFANEDDSEFLNSLDPSQYDKDQMDAIKFYCLRGKTSPAKGERISDLIGKQENVLSNREKSFAKTSDLAALDYATKIDELRKTVCSSLPDLNLEPSLQLRQIDERLKSECTDDSNQEEKCDYLRIYRRIVAGEIEKQEKQIEIAKSEGRKVEAISSFFEFGEKESSITIADKFFLGDVEETPPASRPPQAKKSTRVELAKTGEKKTQGTVSTTTSVVVEDTNSNTSDNTSTNPFGGGITLSTADKAYYEGLSKRIQAERDKISAINERLANSGKSSGSTTTNYGSLGNIQTDFSDSDTDNSYTSGKTTSSSLNPGSASSIYRGSSSNTGVSSSTQGTDAKSVYTGGGKDAFRASINNDVISEEEVYFAKREYRVSSSELIDRYDSLLNEELTLPELILKGEGVERNLGSIFEEQEGKKYEKHRRMALSNEGQYDEFKNLAKMLNKKETFLLSRFNDRDLKLIVRYNNETDEYIVEPFATKDHYRKYKKSYNEFKESVVSAIQKATFDKLQKNYGFADMKIDAGKKFVRKPASLDGTSQYSRESLINTIDEVRDN